MVSWVGAAMTFNLFGFATIFVLGLLVLVNTVAAKKHMQTTEDELKDYTEFSESNTEIEEMKKY